MAKKLRYGLFVYQTRLNACRKQINKLLSDFAHLALAKFVGKADDFGACADEVG